MINLMFSWCSTSDMTVNIEKTKVVHFKKGPATQRMDYVFMYGDHQIETCDKYRYLGLVLTEHLDYTVTAKNVAQAAHRAVGSLIAKAQAHGGFPYKIFSKLYNAVVQPILHYGSHVWRDKCHRNVVAAQNCALRFFLGVRKRTPIAAMQGYMGWSSQEHRQWVTVIRQWCRLSNMSNQRVNQKVFQWCMKSASEGVKNTVSQIQHFLYRIGLHQLTNGENTPRFEIVKRPVDQHLTNHFVFILDEKIKRDGATNGTGLNKLRTYRLFKHVYGVDKYVNIMSKRQRRAIAKFRFGTAPLSIETGRCTGEPEENRLCRFCS